jgi:hypothetical protein
MGSHSNSFWSTVWWAVVHFNHNETVRIAWGSGLLFNAVWYVGGKIPIFKNGVGFGIITALETYLFYFSAVASHAATRGRCVAVMFYGKKYLFSHRVKSYWLPVIWPERCR